METTAIRLISAMKIKNRIVEYIQTQEGRLGENSHLESVSPKYNAAVALDEIVCAKNDLVTVKMLIAVANHPIQEDIYSMSELKGTLNSLGRINTFSGPRHRPAIQEPDMYVADLTQQDMERIHETCRKEINLIQDRLDEYNNTSLVDIPVDIKTKYWA